MARNGAARRLAPLESPKGTKDKWPENEPAGAKRSRASGPRGKKAGKSKGPSKVWSFAGARAFSLAETTGYVPSHVRSCHRSAWEGSPMAIYVWPEASPESQVRIPHACNSWRCSSPECQRAAHRKDFSRINTAIRDVGDDDGWVFMVLTIDRNGRFAGEKPFRNEQEAFKALSTMERKGLKRLARRLEKAGFEAPEHRHVSTVESHRNGWPHLNLVFYAPELAAQLRAELEALGGVVDDPKQLEHATKGTARRMLRDAFCGTQAGEKTRRGEWLAPLFGIKSVADVVRGREQIAGYIAKVAGSGQTAGEVAKLCQAPVHARFKLRRIRAGKGFLPKEEKNDAWTGTMVRRRRSDEGDWEPAPVVDPTTCRMVRWEDSDEETQAAARSRYVAGVRRAQQTEIDLSLEEESRPGREVTTDTREFIEGLDVTGLSDADKRRAAELTAGLKRIENEHPAEQLDVQRSQLPENVIAISRASTGSLTRFGRPEYDWTLNRCGEKQLFLAAKSIGQNPGGRPVLGVCSGDGEKKTHPGSGLGSRASSPSPDVPSVGGGVGNHGPSGRAGRGQLEYMASPGGDVGSNEGDD